MIAIAIIIIYDFLFVIMESILKQHLGNPGFSNDSYYDCDQ